MGKDSSWMDLHKLVSDYDVRTHFPDWDVKAGVFTQGGSSYQLLGIKIIDLRHEDKPEYTTRFNVDWCPESQRKWLASVLIDTMLDLIKKSEKSTIKRIKEPYLEFMKAMNINF